MPRTQWPYPVRGLYSSVLTRTLPLKNEGGPVGHDPPRFVPAIEAVRHVGDPVAFVVADALGAVRDAAEAAAVEHDPFGHCGHLDGASPRRTGQCLF